MTRCWDRACIYFRLQLEPPEAVIFEVLALSPPCSIIFGRKKRLKPGRGDIHRVCLRSMKDVLIPFFLAAHTLTEREGARIALMSTKTSSLCDKESLAFRDMDSNSTLAKSVSNGQFSFDSDSFKLDGITRGGGRGKPSLYEMLFPDKLSGKRAQKRARDRAETTIIFPVAHRTADLI